MVNSLYITIDNNKKKYITTHQKPSFIDGQWCNVMFDEVEYSTYDIFGTNVQYGQCYHITIDSETLQITKKRLVEIGWYLTCTKHDERAIARRWDGKVWCATKFINKDYESDDDIIYICKLNDDIDYFKKLM